MSKNKRNLILGTYLLRIGIAVMILVLSFYLYTKLDLSLGKVNSLGKYSRETVSKLPDKMVVKVYTSKDLPGEFSTIQRYLKDLLTEYRRASKGKFTFEYARFKDHAELVEQAQINGLHIFPIQIYENDQLSMKEIVSGVVFESGGHHDIMNVYPGMESTLEYNITKTIQNLSGAPHSHITVFQDSLYSHFPTQVLSSELRDNYRQYITSLDSLSRFDPVMLFTGVSEDLSIDQLYTLDQYIMKGGKVVFLQDRITADNNGLRIMDSNIFDLLYHYGVMVQPNMVLDSECYYGTGQGLGSWVPYLFFPVVKGMDKVPITAGNDNILLYFASEITAADSVNIKFEPILQTSPNSGTMQGPIFNLDAIASQPDPNLLLGKKPITVGAKIEGKLTSFFADMPDLQKPGFVSSRKDAQFIIFGDRELFMDPETPEYINRSFVVLNAIDHYLGQDSRINIRSRKLGSSRLDVRYYMLRRNMNPAEPEPVIRRLSLVFKLVAILVPPILILALGLLVWSSHKKKRLQI